MKTLKIPMKFITEWTSPLGDHFEPKIEPFRATFVSKIDLVKFRVRFPDFLTTAWKLTTISINQKQKRLKPMTPWRMPNDLEQSLWNFWRILWLNSEDPSTEEFRTYDEKIDCNFEGNYSRILALWLPLRIGSRRFRYLSIEKHRLVWNPLKFWTCGNHSLGSLWGIFWPIFDKYFDLSWTQCTSAVSTVWRIPYDLFRVYWIRNGELEFPLGSNDFDEQSGH